MDSIQFCWIDHNSEIGNFDRLKLLICRLAKLTTMTEANADKQLNEPHPDHFQALAKAEPVDQQVPTLKEEKSGLEASQKP